jgi:toxin ParE1/3/4
MRVEWSARAVQDLNAIFDYIALDNPVAALQWVHRLQARARLAGVAPLAGRVVPELERDDVREVFLHSYRIVYRVLSDEVHVLTVFEGHRMFPRNVAPTVEGDEW